MSRTLQTGLLALLVGALGADAARADWWCPSGYTVRYYYPTYCYAEAPPIYYVVQPSAIAYPVPTVRPGVPAGGYAQPTPAPPSTGKEPPLAKKGINPPTVIESKSHFSDDGKAATNELDASGKPLCRVGFWNVTGRDVKLTVDGKSFTVTRDHNLTLNVSRTFAWQVDGREPRTENVPVEQSSHEIVIR
jgi:hypothetical protein